MIILVVKVGQGTVMFALLVRVRASGDANLSPTFFRAVSEQFWCSFGAVYFSDQFFKGYLIIYQYVGNFLR